MPEIGLTKIDTPSNLKVVVVNWVRVRTVITFVPVHWVLAIKVRENVPDSVVTVAMVTVFPKEMSRSPSSKPVPEIVIVVPTEPLSGDLRVRYAGVMKKDLVRSKIVIVFAPAD